MFELGAVKQEYSYRASFYVNSTYTVTRAASGATI